MMSCVRAEALKDDSRPINQVYEQFQLATGIQVCRSKW